MLLLDGFAFRNLTLTQNRVDTRDRATQLRELGGLSDLIGGRAEAQFEELLRQGLPIETKLARVLAAHLLECLLDCHRVGPRLVDLSLLVRRVSDAAALDHANFDRQLVGCAVEGRASDVFGYVLDLE